MPFIHKHNLFYNIYDIDFCNYTLHLFVFFRCLSKFDLNASADLIAIELVINLIALQMYFTVFCRILSQFADVNTYSNIGMLSFYDLQIFILHH